MAPTNRNTRRQFRLLVVPLALLVSYGLAACSDGYPTEDMVGGVLLNESDGIDRLNDVLEKTLKTYAAQLLLPNICLLRVIWNSDRQTSDYSLMRLVVTTRTDATARETDLLLQTSHASDQVALTLFRTDDWVDLATFRSQINLLRGDCAESQPHPPT